MLYNEIGFRAIYHQICACKFNEQLRELTKDCPEAGDSTHAVVYGYIDPRKGLMLEILGTGKMGRKYFHFKAPWTGKRLTISISDAVNVDFNIYKDLDPQLYSKYQPKIEALKKYDVSENIEKSRYITVIDTCRDPFHPDKITVRFMKNGLKPENIPVQITDLGDHCLIGTLLKKPRQNFGPGKGDTIQFHTLELDDKTIICTADFNEGGFRREDFENGSALKSALTEFRNNPSEDNFNIVLIILRSSSVCFPMEMHLTEEAAKILAKLKQEGKDQSSLEGEELERFQGGTRLFPPLLSQNGKTFFPVFTDPSEFKQLSKPDGVPAAHTAFLKAMHAALSTDDLFAITVNPFSENFVIEKGNFKAISEIKPIFPDEEKTSDGDLDLPDTAQTGNNVLNRMESESDIIYMAVGKADVFNYALYKNDLPPIREVRIANKTLDPIANLKLRVTSDSEIFDTYEQDLPPVQPKYPLDFSIPVTVHAKQLTDITEAIKVNFKMELINGSTNESICQPIEWAMDVLTYDESAGWGYEQYLAAFIMPNHPYIPELAHSASEWLKRNKLNPSLEDYQGIKENPNRPRELAAACYAAIQKKNISYITSPASFERGQRIRTVDKVLDERMGTCMDMTLLYASLLESIGLHSVLVLIKGHIFAGVWMIESSFPDPIINNGNILQKEPNLIFVECTAVCTHEKPVSFEQAEKAARETLNKALSEGAFNSCIDVYTVRNKSRIKPIDPRVSTGTKIIGSDLDDGELTPAPKPIQFAYIETKGPEKASGPKNKIELWESKLLDLSGRNKLLNLPENSSIIPLVSSHIEELEDFLADGEVFSIQQPTTFGLSDDKDRPSVYEIMSHLPLEIMDRARSEAQSHRLYGISKDKALEKNLKTIYRKAKEGEKEYGINSLYLALGMLRWFDPEDEKQTPLYAPLILAPVEIEMKPGGVGYNLRRRFEDPHFNVTLLELLRQRFELGISGLEPLPMDEHGLDVQKIFAIVRGAVRELPHWDVVETAAIGIFDISKIAMWNDLHTAPEMLMNNKAVRSLVMQRVDWDVTAKTEVPDDYRTFVTLPVDATQLEAIDLAARGNTFVLHGPPGTGKSQTITGLIGNALANHKTVLFVAEKATALDVVRNRLDNDLHIGDFCLALHADSEKTAILDQMEKTMGKKASFNNPLNPFKNALEKTEARREKLDVYADHLHRRQNCGHSLRELIDLYCREADDAPYISFKKEEAAQLTAADLQTHIPLIEQLLAAKRTLDDDARLLMNEIGISVYNGDVRSRINHQTEDYRSLLLGILESGGKTAEILGLSAPKTFSDLNMLYQRVSGIHELAGERADIPDISKIDLNAAQKYFAEAEAADRKRRELLKLWTENFLRMQPSVFREKLAAAQKKFLTRKKAVTQVMNELEAYAHRPLSETEVPELLKNVEALQRDEAHLELTLKSLSNETRDMITRYGSPEAFRQAYESAAAYRQKEADLTGGKTIRSLKSSVQAAEVFSAFRDEWQKLQSMRTEIASFLVRPAEKLQAASIQDELEFCDRILENRSGIKKLALYNQCKQACVRVGLTPVVQACEEGMDDPDTLKTAYRKGLYYALINNTIYHDDLLTSFTGESFNTAIDQYKRLDDDLREKSTNELYHRLAMNIPSDLESPAIAKQMTILRKAIKSRGRGVALRQLFEQIPDILYRLCPCMLMSPETVAQYLPQRNDLFDLVVFDEASQISTSRAIGALARGKDAVIVGDPEQMPPTNFFGGGARIQNTALDDLDSILDDALAIGIPSRYLKWHYRSSHESLITFSNRNFYHNEMFTFPSVDDRARRVRRIWVESNYKKSVNENEAREIVKEILRRYKADKTPEKGTIGIIAFNEKQRDYIDDLLEKQCQQDRGLSDWVHKELGKKTKVEIKPLEKVQGDEWDTVIFSITFGPDEKGHVLQNFGPINKEGGGKRLNVAFSRAVREMLIFTGMRSSDIKITDSTPSGAKAFHDFLEFAERLDAVSPEEAPEQNVKTKSGIVQRISAALADQGYICIPDIGTSDFHIDIGVLDPYDPSQYLLGILLDGETYRQTKNTRDREIGQKGLLEGKFGWELYRIWAIDWWEDQQEVLDHLLSKLDDLRTAAAEKAEIKNEEPQPEAVSAEEEKALDEKLAQQADEIEAEMDDADYEPELTEEAPVQSSQETNTETTAAEPHQETTEDSVSEESSKEEAHSDDEPYTQPEEELQTQSNLANEPKEPETDEPLIETGYQPEPESEQDSSAEEEIRTERITLSGLLEEAGVETIDKRPAGGVLWIIGGMNLQPLVQRCKEIGVNFTFKAGGGKVCKGRDAWWTADKDPEPVIIKQSGTEPEAIKDLPVSDENDHQRLTPHYDEPAEAQVSYEESGINEQPTTAADEPAAEAYTGKLYVPTKCPESQVGWEDYIKPSNKAEIMRRAVIIVEGEGVIERDKLIDWLRNSFWIKRPENVLEATEKALKSAKIKTTKVKGIPYCWASDIDPKAYTGFRYHEEKKRDPEDLPLPEMRNAIVRTLMDNGPLDEDTLLTRTARTFGYQRLGPNLKKQLLEGIEYAVYDKKIRLNKQRRYELREL